MKPKKKLLVIFAHPPGDSFNKALLNAFCDGAESAGHEIDLVDLYIERFNPVLMDSDSRAEVKADARSYQQKIKEADTLAFIYPTFWYRAPAILEGWFDRVFTSHFAFKYVPALLGMKRPLGLLSDKTAIVIDTYGGPGWYYKWLTTNIPWQRLKAVLNFCGIRKVRHLPCYSVPFAKDKVRERYLKQARRLGERIK
jgi:NAD(P)H dehydrogenase (quinone)